MPLGCNDDEFPWGKDTSSLDNKSLYGMYIKSFFYFIAANCFNEVHVNLKYKQELDLFLVLDCMRFLLKLS